MKYLGFILITRPVGEVVFCEKRQGVVFWVSRGERKESSKFMSIICSVHKSLIIDFYVHVGVNIFCILKYKNIVFTHDLTIKLLYYFDSLRLLNLLHLCSMFITEIHSRLLWFIPCYRLLWFFFVFFFFKKHIINQVYCKQVQPFSPFKFGLLFSYN